MTSTTSFKQFSLENDMQDISQDDDAMNAIYKYDLDEQKTLLDAKPWKTECVHSKVLLLTIALITSKIYAFQLSHS